jgi:sugar O-acyltransferase (sialic acid O-acetyltransferase NeuD family)
MADVYIFGVSGLARIIAEYIKEDTLYNFSGFTLDKEYCKAIEICNSPLIPFEELSDKNVAIINCIGYNKMLTLRETIDKKIREAGFSLLSYIHKDAKIMKGVKVGNSCLIMADAFVNYHTQIGNGNILWSNHIEHDCIIGDYNFFAISSSMAGDVTINNHCFFGNNSTIKDNTKIASYTLVGAGAYVNKNTTEYDVIVPAKSVKLENKKSIDFNF